MEINKARALITGASSGIGKAIAIALASEGADLFITGRDESRLKEVKTHLEQSGSKADFSAADLSRIDDIEKMFESAISSLGGIDILINNAGLGIKAEVADMAISDWRQTIDVNLTAPFIISKLAANHMKKQKSGYIINIGSGASQTPIAEFAAYCASKFGLLGFSESLGLELRDHNIKVSIILPGSTATNFAGGDPQKKIELKPGILRPDDIAETVLFLLRQSDIAWTSVMNLRPLNISRGQI